MFHYIMSQVRCSLGIIGGVVDRPCWFSLFTDGLSRGGLQFWIRNALVSIFADMLFTSWFVCLLISIATFNEAFGLFSFDFH